MTQAIASRKMKKDGTPDLRFGARIRVRIAPLPVPFTIEDHAVSDRHVEDFEAAGVSCRILDGVAGRPEAWEIDGARRAFRLTIYRAGRRVFVEETMKATGEVRRDVIGSTSTDDAWREARILFGLQDRSYARAATLAHVVTATLPAWLSA